jgi:hypothetical protein
MWRIENYATFQHWDRAESKQPEFCSRHNPHQAPALARRAPSLNNNIADSLDEPQSWLYTLNGDEWPAQTTTMPSTTTWGPMTTRRLCRYGLPLLSGLMIDGLD